MLGAVLYVPIFCGHLQRAANAHLNWSSSAPSNPTTVLLARPVAVPDLSCNGPGPGKFKAKFYGPFLLNSPLFAGCDFSFSSSSTATTILWNPLNNTWFSLYSPDPTKGLVALFLVRSGSSYPCVTILLAHHHQNPGFHARTQSDLVGGQGCNITPHEHAAWFAKSETSLFGSASILLKGSHSWTGA